MGTTNWLFSFKKFGAVFQLHHILLSTRPVVAIICAHVVLCCTVARIAFSQWGKGFVCNLCGKSNSTPTEAIFSVVFTAKPNRVSAVDSVCSLYGWISRSASREIRAMWRWFFVIWQLLKFSWDDSALPHHPAHQCSTLEWVETWFW